jgi:hypothetical protein
MPTIGRLLGEVTANPTLRALRFLSSIIKNWIDQKGKQSDGAKV